MFVLVLIGVPVVELFVFVEVGHAIGLRLALLLVLVGSVIGARVTRVQGRAAIERVSLAVSENRAPAGAAIDGALGFLGGVLLTIPGFVTDFFGVLLLLPPTRKLTRRRISRHYAGRAMRFVAATGRFASRERGVRQADVESTAVEDDFDQLGR
jgi:UPF0716 protein FxsA